MTDVALFMGHGMVAGMASGLIGIGGGAVIVPAPVLIFGFLRKLVQGTTIAHMIPPPGALAAWTSCRHGHVDVRTAVVICSGFLAGSFMAANPAGRRYRRVSHVR